MALEVSYTRRELHFRHPARTSRGAYLTRIVYYIKATDSFRSGVGECAPLPGLSIDDRPDFEQQLQRVCHEINMGMTPDLSELPSIRFGLESALADLRGGGRHILFDTPFSRGEQGICINGLVWIDTPEAMLEAARAKVEAGFECVKIKIGANPFDMELEAIRIFRETCPQVELRLDANGAWHSVDVALDALERLAPFGIHSLEQPLPAGHPVESARVCAASPIPVALDEELIRLTGRDERRRMLEIVKPAYIILKPTLCGGMAGCGEWMRLADEAGIGYWLTSALESDVGLNAIAQYAAQLGLQMPQGLGTGMLFTDNIMSPLHLDGQRLWYNPQDRWESL